MNCEDGTDMPEHVTVKDYMDMFVTGAFVWFYQ